MSDLIQRLNECLPSKALQREAAAEIERLEGQITRWECESHPWEHGDDPIVDPLLVRHLTDAAIESAERQRDEAQAELAQCAKWHDEAIANRLKEEQARLAAENALRELVRLNEIPAEDMTRDYKAHLRNAQAAWDTARRLLNQGEKK